MQGNMYKHKNNCMIIVSIIGKNDYYKKQKNNKHKKSSIYELSHL